MSMHRECNRVREQMEVWDHSPPEWVQAHLRQCRACGEEWQREQQYRRVVQAARREPMPACQLRWEQVQAQLTARAIRQRTFRWRLALTGAFASLLALVALGSLWLIYSSQNNSAAQPLHPLHAMTNASAPPRYEPSHTTKVPHDGQLGGNQPATLPAEGKQALAPEPSKPAALPLAAHSENSSSPKAVEWKFVAQAPPAKGQSLHREFARTKGDKPLSEQSHLSKAVSEPFVKGESDATVALLLPDLRPENGGNADYLPVQYGSEESHVYSF
ncbi:hypothetical protein HRbin15_00911 [bacterium HR15]|nr:hypothetical protein HRbin15_00911 [bacterium HR15]